jgi:uncharacterized protein with LGFP repeats
MGVTREVGYPLTDETQTPDGLGRFNHFEGGSIYWKPGIGAHEVHGAILDKWGSMGWERSFLGYPTSDEISAPGGGRVSNIEHGSIGWTASGGATVAAAAQQPVAAAPSPQQSAATTPAPPQTPEGLKPAGFGIRFSTDGAPEEAFHEVGKAKAPPISAKTVYVFKKGGSWVSVAKFGAKDERDRQFSKFKGIWPTASTIPDLTSWCPTPKTISGETKNMAEQFDCGP